MNAGLAGGIDCDLHPAVPGIAALLPYLEPQWADAVAQRRQSDGRMDRRGRLAGAALFIGEDDEMRLRSAHWSRDDPCYRNRY